MRTTAIKAIFNYWRSIATGTVPARTTVDPRALKAHLPDLFMLERLNQARFGFRLAGTRLCARYGRELRNSDFMALWPNAQHAQILTALNRCVQTGQPLVLDGTAAVYDGDSVGFQILVLPLADANGQVSRIMGAMITDNDVAMRYGTPIISQMLQDVTIPDTGLVIVPETTSAFAAARQTSVSFLRVVDGSKMADAPRGANAAA